MAKDILHQPGLIDQTEVESDNNFSQEITIKDVIDAPESEWRRLCDIIDANPAFIERCRARQQADQVKPRRKQRRRSRPSTSTRNWSAASVLNTQAAQQIGAAMVESLDRVNSGELDGAGKTRSILVSAGDATVIMEVVA